jgi:hypothetical protein
MYGVERQSAFVNLLLDWYDAKRGSKLLLKYERLRAKPASELRRFMDFVFPDGFDEDAFDRALAASSFAEMQKKEIELSRSEASLGVARIGSRKWDGNINALKSRKADLAEARGVFWPELWKEMSGLPNTAKLIQRLNYPQ